jgi:hypothetical protein
MGVVLISFMTLASICFSILSSAVYAEDKGAQIGKHRRLSGRQLPVILRLYLYRCSEIQPIKLNQIKE